MGNLGYGKKKPKRPTGKKTDTTLLIASGPENTTKKELKKGAESNREKGSALPEKSRSLRAGWSRGRAKVTGKAYCKWWGGERGKLKRRGGHEASLADQGKRRPNFQTGKRKRAD